MGLAAESVALAAYALTRWADAVWEVAVDRDKVTPEEQEQVQGAAPIEVG